MNAVEAGVIADETIAYWRSRGWVAVNAVEALAMPWSYRRSNWGVVRRHMISWLLAQRPAAMPAAVKRAA